MFQSFFWDQKTLDGTAAQCPLWLLRAWRKPGFSWKWINKRTIWSCM